MVDAWLLFTLMIPFAEVLLHTRMEQLRQKLEQMENKVVAMNISQASTTNQVQPQSEPQSEPQSMIMPSVVAYAWEEDKDQLKKKLRYISFLYPIISMSYKNCPKVLSVLFKYDENKHIS